MLVIYFSICLVCLVSGALVAQYSERVRQMEADVTTREQQNRNLQAEVDRLQFKVKILERKLSAETDAKQDANVRARELEQERDQLRRYLSRSLSPRMNGASPTNMHAIVA